MKQLTRWRKNAVVNIETRKGLYVLAQLLQSPYIHIFDVFSTAEEPSISSLEGLEELFTKAVTRQFIKQTNILVTDIKPNKDLNYDDICIVSEHSTDWLTLWEGADRELTFITTSVGIGGSLIKNQFADDEEIIIEKIDFNDNETIDNFETNGLGVYPALNERLYLCHLYGKNIDPRRDLLFNRPIPIEYYKYMQIISGKVKLKEIGY